ncbi:MAG: hypothetical protein Kow0074_17760 [Candidatus Zixiibacteriota bacterium]
MTSKWFSDVPDDSTISWKTAFDVLQPSPQELHVQAIYLHALEFHQLEDYPACLSELWRIVDEFPNSKILDQALSTLFTLAQLNHFSKTTTARGELRLIADTHARLLPDSPTLSSYYGTLQAAKMVAEANALKDTIKIYSRSHAPLKAIEGISLIRAAMNKPGGE